MLALIRMFPVVATILGGMSGVALAGAGFAFWNRFIDNPGIVREQRAICVAEVEAAAANARRIEQERQVRIANEAMERAARDEAALEAAHANDIDKLTERIKAYEAQRAGEGRSCPLTDADLRFLLDD